MSSFPSQSRRTVVPTTGHRLQPGALTAPGLVPLPAGDSAIRDAESLGRALGILGDTVSREGYIARKEREAEDREAQRVHEGAAASYVAARQADWQSLIDAGKVPFDPNEPPSVSAEAFVATLVDPSLPEPFIRGVRERAVPWVAGKLYERHRRELDDAGRELLQNLKDGATGREDPAELEATAADAIKRLRIPPEKARAEIGLNAMDYAVRLAETDPARAERAFSAAAAFLGEGNHRLEQEVRRLAMGDAIARHRAGREAAVEESLSGVLNSVRRGQGTFEEARTLVERSRESGEVDEKSARRLHGVIESDEQNFSRQTGQLFAERHFEAERQRIVREATSLSRVRTGGGLALLDEEYTLRYEHPSGETFEQRFTRDEITAAVRAAEFKRIDAEVEASVDADPSVPIESRAAAKVARADALKADFIATNPNARWPEMERAFNGISLRYLPGATLTDEDQAFAAEVLSFYRRMEPHSEVRNAHVRNALDQEVLRTASTFMDSIPNLQPADAFQRAVMHLRQKNDRNISPLLPQRDDRAVSRLLRDIGAEGSSNENLMRSEIVNRLQAEIARGSADPEAAVRKTMAEDFTRIHIHGRETMLYTRGRIIRKLPLSDLAKIVATVVTADTLLDRSDVTVAPMPGSRSEWLIAERESLLQIPGTPVLTDADLAAMKEQIDLARQAAGTESERRRREAAQVDPIPVSDRRMQAYRHFDVGAPYAPREVVRIRRLNRPETPARFAHLQPFFDAIWRREDIRRRDPAALLESAPVPGRKPEPVGEPDELTRTLMSMPVRGLKP